MFDTSAAAPNILIADDQLETRLILGEVLAELGNLILVKDGQEALEAIESKLPDIILLDINMPKLTGLEVFEHIQKTPHLCGIPVIFITTQQDSKTEQLCLFEGAIDFIPKPIDVNLCKLRVRNHIRLANARKEAELKQRYLELLVKHTPTVISCWSEDWNFQYSNRLLLDSAGQDVELVEPTTLVNFFGERLATEIKQNDIGSRKHFSYMEETEGTILSWNITMESVVSDKKTRTLVFCENTSELSTHIKALDDQREEYRSTLSSIGDGVIATDKDHKVTFMNLVAERMTGLKLRNAIGRPINEVMCIRDADSKEPGINPLFHALRQNRTVGLAFNTELVSADGAIYRIEDSAAPILDSYGRQMGGVIVFHDVSEAVAMSVKMSHMSQHDSLTDLPNRILCQDRLEYACKLAKYNDKKVALVMIDIDHFKYINDTVGHTLGDHIIQQVSLRLRQCVSEEQSLARIGGDEFAVVVPIVADNSEINTLVSSIHQAISPPISINDKEYTLSVSIGVSIYPDDASTTEIIVSHADAAMYKAKLEGRNQHRYFSAELEQQLEERNLVEATLRSAIKHKKLIVHFQPKFDMTNQRLLGAEALVRLRSENQGSENQEPESRESGEQELIRPDLFIPLAEDTGLIVELGLQVLQQSLIQLKHWQSKLKQDFVMSVNVSGRQLMEPDFVESVVNLVKECDVKPDCLELEITESTLMMNLEYTNRILSELSEFGIRISIDDFGTGYSSLAYLKKLKVDTLKIDQSFVRDMLVDKEDHDLIKTIISLGDTFKLSLIAEGVETTEQESELIKLGCHHAQGYLYSKPLDVALFESKFLTN